MSVGMVSALSSVQPGYFTSEEEYLAHWNSFHVAVSPWFICPATSCEYVATGEPDARDRYLCHMAEQHVVSQETGLFEREEDGYPFVGSEPLFPEGRVGKPLLSTWRCPSGSSRREPLFRRCPMENAPRSG